MVWDLTVEDALPKGSTISGSKSLIDQYPEDAPSSKKTKKTNTGKGKKGNPKNKKLRIIKDDMRPMRGHQTDWTQHHLLPLFPHKAP